MDEFFNQPDDLGTVTLTLDNDEELECDIITFFTAGDNEYVALAPQGDEFDGHRLKKSFQENAAACDKKSDCTK